VTPLQLATAFAAVANGGDLVEPYVVARIGDGEEAIVPHPEPVHRGRPVSARTVAVLRDLLASVTLEGGTGRGAAIAGYPVAGKTGTAQKAVPGRGYLADQFIASFAGFAPVDRPVLAGVVVIDDPRGSYHGGEVAAPVFAAVVGKALLYLDVPPQRERPELWPFEAEPVDPMGPQPTAPVTIADGSIPTERVTEPPPGTIPDLSGRTAREAVAMLASLEVRPLLDGKGVVVGQQLPPGSPPPPPGSAFRIALGPPPGRALVEARSELDTGAGG